MLAQAMWLPSVWCCKKWLPSVWFRKKRPPRQHATISLLVRFVQASASLVSVFLFLIVVCVDGVDAAGNDHRGNSPVPLPSDNQESSRTSSSPPHPDPSRPGEHGHGGVGRRRGEHGGRGPGVGNHQRPDAPGRARLGPPLPLPPRRLRRRPAVGGPPPHVAVLSAVPRQPLRLRRLLQPPRRRPHLRRRARHQRHHFRRHRRRRRAPRGGQPRRARRARHRAHRARSLGLHLLAFLAPSPSVYYLQELNCSVFSTAHLSSRSIPECSFWEQRGAIPGYSYSTTHRIMAMIWKDNSLYD